MVNRLMIAAAGAGKTTYLVEEALKQSGNVLITTFTNANEMEIKKKLMMTFKTDEDKNTSISIDDPRENLNETEIKNVMQLILEKDIFSISGASLVELVEAKVIETGTTEFDLA